MNYLKRVVKQKQPDCIFLMETKVNKACMVRVCRSLKFKNLVIMEAKGIAEGITLMWTDDFKIDCT